MSAIPSNLARVPNTLASQIMLSSLTHNSRNLLNAQVQLATGLRVNRPSDDAVAASTISVLDDVIERRDQRLRNLSHAESVLNNIDAGLSDASELLLEAKGIGSSQIGLGSDTDTRKNQAKIIEAMVQEMANIANRQYQDVFFFGGKATADAPVTSLLGGYTYNGTRDGMVTDLGLSRSMPITVNGEDAFGSLSARVQGDRDLNPGIDPAGTTRLVDLNGAGGFGVRLGSVTADINGTDVEIDLTGVHTVADLVATLQTQLQTVDAGAAVSIGGASNSQISIVPSAGTTITISDLSADATAFDLGIDQTFPPGGALGGDLNPRITERTLISDLDGVTVPLGTIRLTNAGQSRDLDLSGAVTVQDVQNAVAGLNIGIRVEINDAADRLNFVNQLSGGSMGIAEVGGGLTATELGVRSFTETTLLADFNNELGVEIRSGSVDPISGAPDPAADIDFRITLADGREIDVDLAGDVTVDDVITSIRTARDALAIAPADFEVNLASDGNGFEFTDNTGPGTFSVTRMNGSAAAENLGILGSTTGATFTGEDRATVAVESVFSHLIALRDALNADDSHGITLATEKLEGDLSRLTETRAEVGVRAQRVQDAVYREEDLRLQDIQLRSEFQDLDYTEAAIRFSTLQQQLQAGLQTARLVNSLSLLDFLGLS